MEYVWKCFDAEGAMKKAGNCKIMIFVIYLVLFLLLTRAVASGFVGILLMIFALTDFCPMSMIPYAFGAREHYRC
jgi:hypothetical protein